MDYVIAWPGFYVGDGVFAPGSVHPQVRGGATYLAGLLLAWTAAVTLVRIAELASGAVPLRAHGERAFFDWAWRGGEVRRELAEAGSRLRAGQRVWVASPDPRYDPGWLQVMALYYLPRQVVVGAGARAAPERDDLVSVVLAGARRAAEPLTAFANAADRGAVLLATALGAALVLLVGRAALGSRGGLSPSELAGDGAVGLALLCPLVFLLGMLGLPLGPAPLAGYEVAFAAVLLRSSRRAAAPALFVSPGAVRSRPPAGWRDPIALVCELTALLAFAVACWKWARVPLWSWDHYAIWGMKARRIVADGRFDLAFLKLPEFASSVPGYPIGLPIAWRILFPGQPGAFAFKLCHALFAAGLLASIRAAALRIVGSRALASALAGIVAVSPLFWDTEALGMAEMPFAFVAVSSVALLLRARDEASFLSWPAGLALGFLSWIKAEGALLAVLLAGVAVLSLPRALSRSDRIRRAGAIFLPAFALIAASALVRRAFLGAGISFFEGNWPARVAARLRDPAGILALLIRELLQADWMGVWPLAIAGFLFAIARRRQVSTLLLGAVGAQMAAYGAVYFATYLDPAAHIRSSFFRIAAGLVPNAILGAGTAFPAARSPGLEASSTAEALATPRGSPP